MLLEERIEKIREKIKKQEEKKEKLLTQVEKIDQVISALENELNKAKEEQTVHTMLDLASVANNAGVDINDLKAALLSGDFLALQEKLEAKANEDNNGSNNAQDTVNTEQNQTLNSDSDTSTTTF